MMTDSLFLSVVIPTWNEQIVILGTLETVVTYLNKQEYTSEVIVVDDGSSDDTVRVVKSFIERVPSVRLIENDHRGKGYAVRSGMLTGKGRYVLFTDADLATPIYEVGKMIGALEAGCDVAIGTREGIGAVRMNEPFYHHAMGRIFNLVVRLISGLRFQDTQCGFKGFRYEVAQDLFSRVRLYGQDAKTLKGGAVTGFDVEILYLALQTGYRIEEIPVKWRYGTESKANHPLEGSVRMVWDVVQVRRMARKGLYEENE
jgi:dolichyl-phosphate beta-glucosyltransferase